MVNMIPILPVLRGTDSLADANIQFVLCMFKIRGCKITHTATSLILILNVPHPAAVSAQIERKTTEKRQ